MLTYNGRLHLVTFLVYTAAFLAIVVGLLMALNLRTFMAHWGQNLGAVFYLVPEVQKQEIEALQTEIKKLDFVEDVEVITPDQAIGELAKDLELTGLNLNQDWSAIIPFSLQVKLKETVNDQRPTLLKDLADRFRSAGIVESVSYGYEWVKSYQNFYHFTIALGVLVGIFLIAACVLIISNVTRAVVSSESGTLQIMSYLGANNWQMRKALVIRGTGIGLLGCIFALFIAFGLLSAIEDLWRQKTSASLNLRYFSLPVSTLIFILAGFLGGASAYFSLNKEIEQGG